MQTLKLTSIILPLCMALVATAGCGDDSEAQSVVDTASLQPGNYSTSPRTPEEVRTPENIDIQEALRLGAHVPLIMESSPRLVFNNVQYQRKMFTPLMPPDKPDNFSSNVPGLIAGWETVGQRRENSTQGRTVELTVMRFSEPGQATHAAEFLSDAELHGNYPPVGPISIPGYPRAIGQAGRLGSISARLAEGPFVLEIWVGPGVDIPPDPAALADLTRSIFDKQFEELQNYQPTPLDKIDELPVDKDGILTFTLPPSDGVVESVMGPGVALNFMDRPDLAKRAFQDAEVDLVAHGETSIYRAGDPAAADRLKAYFVSQLDPVLQPVDTPPGLPTAHCVDDPGHTSSLACVFTSGRYTVIIDGANQIQDLHQRVSAQYLLLDQAP